MADDWTPVSGDGNPALRQQLGWAWAASDLVIWGGYLEPNVWYDDGARYDPVTDIWTSLPPVELSERNSPALVPTPCGLMVWGGQAPNSMGLGDGAIYSFP